MTPADVLRKAADYIAEHGWVQGRLGGGGGPNCAMGAIAVAADSARGARDAEYELLAYVGDVGVVRWNDHPSRTAEEVISTLRTVADRLDAHPDRDRGEGEK